MSKVPALAVEELHVEFRTRSGIVRAVENVGFSIAKGETVALVGESGSGKSVTAYAVMGILDPAGRVTSGRALFGGADLLHLPEPELAEVRGRDLSMIFQSPRTALNPIRRVGDQLRDVLVRHAGATRVGARRQAVELLQKVRIPDPERRASAYPFELSGGMCQRIMIALALACRPAVLIADEPTTGLDVTTQATIMDLVAELASDSGMATILITHDLALAAEYCSRIMVMHAGHLVEDAPTPRLLQAASHPYSARLIAATPSASLSLDGLAAIPGNLPDLRRADLPSCRYSERCERRLPECDLALLRQTRGESHVVACRNPL